jgi:hypothetical protein
VVSGQFDCCSELSRTAIEVSSRGGDALMSSERLKNVYGCTFIGKGCEEGATPTVTTSALDPSAFVDLRKGLSEAIC